jgi:hypothetical protein
MAQAVAPGPRKMLVGVGTTIGTIGTRKTNDPGDDTWQVVEEI